MATQSTVPASACARDLLVMIPHLMQEIRHGMRQGRDAGLTVPQFRALAMIDHQPGASLSELAAHVGLGAPAMSVLVEALVGRGLMRRQRSDGDRRQLRLNLTVEGRAVLVRSRATARRLLADRLTALSDEEMVSVTNAIGLLNRIFAAPLNPSRSRSPRS